MELTTLDRIDQLLPMYMHELHGDNEVLWHVSSVTVPLLDPANPDKIGVMTVHSNR